jgi:hypothetical protein
VTGAVAQQPGLLDLQPRLGGRLLDDALPAGGAQVDLPAAGEADLDVGEGEPEQGENAQARWGVSCQRPARVCP